MPSLLLFFGARFREVQVPLLTKSWNRCLGHLNFGAKACFSERVLNSIKKNYKDLFAKLIKREVAEELGSLGRDSDLTSSYGMS